MSFLQIVKYQTDRPGEVAALAKRWEDEVHDTTHVRRVQIGFDRDDIHSWWVIAELDSQEALLEHATSEQTEFYASQLAKLCTQPPNFTYVETTQTMDFPARRGLG